MAAPGYLAWLVAVLLVQCVCSQETSTPVNTSAGLVLGRMSTVLVDGRQVQVETFWGIPYARPPIGPLRFERPSTVRPWEGVRNAWDTPKACMQKVNKVVTSPDQMSEDCLYLNIWRPYCNQTNMTTMVWVHGGSLSSGSSADPMYNGEKLAATECVIVASMNYRLGIFGFHYTFFYEANVGLYDVVYALRFINSNINKFGGNNSSITLFGGGAGAYIVSIFLISTEERHLFRNAILQSGSPLMEMMYQHWRPALDAAYDVAGLVNCSYTRNAPLLACLRDVNATDLLDASYTATGSTHGQFRWISSYDDRLLKRNPLVYLRQKSIKNCSILVGTNKDEGTESLIKILPRQFNTSNREPPVFTEQRINVTLGHFLGMLYKAKYLHNIVAAIKLIYNYYCLRSHATNSTLHVLSNLCRDLAYTCPLQTLIDTYTQLGNQVYVYSFDRAPHITDLPAWVGATHRSEIRYIFRSAPSNQSENFVDEEIVLSRQMMKLWANFARHGNPTPQGQLTPQWQAYMPGNNVMHFTEQATMKLAARDHNHRCRYWNSMPDRMRLHDPAEF